MQAIILAAGMGKRLKELTKNNTKCMVEVNGVTLIERMLRQIDKFDMTRVVIVEGYEGEKLVDFVNTLDIKTPISFVHNPIYDQTNNIYSLSLAKEQLVEEDTLLFESDLIFDDDVIELLLNDSRDTLALVAKYESWMDGTCVKLSDDDRILSFIPGKQVNFGETDEYYKTVNIYKFSKEFSRNYYVPFLDAYQSALGQNEYYEQVLRVITLLDKSPLRARKLSSELWYEIDDIQDLDIATSMFASNEDRVDLLSNRYGGYWRYPRLLDFCYLVNPYFPPQRMVDELKANFQTLLMQYPSGQRVNSLLAAKNFDVNAENIVVGNGAAELIKSLMESFEGKLGIIRPTFEEYAHRYNEEDVVAFWPETYSYSVDDIISYFEDKSISNLVIINPDNPSGNYISRDEVIRLIYWAKSHAIKIVIDESFVDFSNEAGVGFASLIDRDILALYDELYVMKSISKSYGVPGLRLGVLVSNNAETIARIKRDVSIWNINSFAEFYMQIEEKYKNDYLLALEKFRIERARFVDLLNGIKGLRVLSSQANFVMVEITSGMTSRELNRRLISNHDILIKDLVPKLLDKSHQYVRIAVRNTEDNDRLISALKEEL